MPVEIRKLTAGDRPGIEAALRSDKTFRAEEINVALELIDDALQQGDRDYWVRIASTEDLPVAGYVCFGPTPMTNATWDLYWIVTHTQGRGQGVASSLIRAMESELRERDATAIRVETSQTEGYGAARKLYARLEYPEQARFADFYKPGDDLIVYYKKL